MITAIWPGDTCICIGSGPSLTPADVDFCRGKARVLVVNDGWRLAPWADIMYACDGRFWDYYKGVPEFTGLKFGLTVKRDKWPGVTRLEHLGREGLDPKGIYDGANGGYQAIQLAVHLGAARVVLLGYDMQPGINGRDHWFGKHPAPIRATSPYPVFCAYFRGLRVPHKARGVEVVNCSRSTALETFPKARLEDVLARCEVAAA